MPDDILNAMMMPDITAIRDATRMLRARGMLRLGEGKSSAAAEDFLACHRLARLLAEDPTVICWLVGTVIEHATLDADTVLAHYGGLNPHQLDDYQRAAHQLPPLPRFADKIEAERFMALDAVTAVASGRMDVDGLHGDGKQPQGHMLMRVFDVNEMLRTVNAAYDDLTAASALPDPAHQKEAIQNVVDKWQRLARDSNSIPNRLWGATVTSQRHASRRMAYLFVSLFMPALQSLPDLQQAMQRRRLLTDVTFELAAYRAKQGSYPETLQVLGPQVMADVANDLFAGAPVQYHRTQQGYVLRSSAGPAGPEADEYAVVIEMPIPPRKAEEK